MHPNFERNLPGRPTLTGSALITFSFAREGATDEACTLPAGLALSALTVANSSPHPLAQLQLRRVVAGADTSTDADMGIAGHLAQHAQEVLAARWKGEPWRWEQERATHLFALLRAFTQDLRGQERDKVHVILIESVDYVARALMVSPATERKLMPNGPTTHEMALMWLLHCAPTIVRAVAATELHAGSTHNSLDGCLETLEAALTMVKRAAMPSS